MWQADPCTNSRSLVASRTPPASSPSSFPLLFIATYYTLSRRIDSINAHRAHVRQQPYVWCTMKAMASGLLHQLQGITLYAYATVCAHLARLCPRVSSPVKCTLAMLSKYDQRLPGMAVDHAGYTLVVLEGKVGRLTISLWAAHSRQRTDHAGDRRHLISSMMTAMILTIADCVRPSTTSGLVDELDYAHLPWIPRSTIPRLPPKYHHRTIVDSNPDLTSSQLGHYKAYCAWITGYWPSNGHRSEVYAIPRGCSSTLDRAVFLAFFTKRCADSLMVDVRA